MVLDRLRSFPDVPVLVLSESAVCVVRLFHVQVWGELTLSIVLLPMAPVIADSAMPVALIEWQPGPTPVVQVRALVAPLQLGIARAAGGPMDIVPRRILADCGARSVRGIAAGGHVTP